MHTSENDKMSISLDHFFLFFFFFNWLMPTNANDKKKTGLPHKVSLNFSVFLAELNKLDETMNAFWEALGHFNI